MGKERRLEPWIALYTCNRSARAAAPVLCGETVWVGEGRQHPVLHTGFRHIPWIRRNSKLAEPYECRLLEVNLGVP